jgi:hypothetical protein
MRYDVNRHDIITLIKNLKKIYNLPYTLYKTVNLIKNCGVPYKYALVFSTAMDKKGIQKRIMI